MSDAASASPVAEQPVESQEKAPTAQATKPGPADDIRNIQMLLINGIFPGNVAPQVVQAYKTLESMAVKLEADASK